MATSYASFSCSTRNSCGDARLTSAYIRQMDIHERIKTRRTEKGLSMQAVADHCELKSWQAVQQWERPDDQGGTTPRRKALLKLAEILEVTPEWIQFGKDSGEPKRPQFGRRDDAWPFTFSAQEFAALPAEQRGRINGYAQAVIDDWRARSGKGHGRSA